MKDRNKQKRKQSAANTDNSHTPNGFYSILAAIIAAVEFEIKSWAGKVNIFFDVILAGLIVVYFLSSSAVSITRIIVTIFNQELTKDTGDPIFILLLIFIGASILCIVFMYFVEREYRKESTREHPR